LPIKSYQTGRNRLDNANLTLPPNGVCAAQTISNNACVTEIKCCKKGMD